MNSVIENVKRRPNQFILSFILPCLMIWVALLILESNIQQVMITGVGSFILLFMYFNLFISSEVLSEKLNKIVKEKNISKEKLFEITGLTKYEVTEKENHFEFYMSSSRKKKYMRLLESM
ncbi:hypothetical protein [Mammaliicoccus vitulinus]|uniref:hypothetical protein n=1 Tax=Mammaliicoccus vitulinus TaxID=71237 RepID=UPI003BA3C289